MAKLEVNSRDIGRGQVLSVTVEDTGQTQILFIPKDVPPAVEQAAARLLAAYTLFNREAVRAVETYVSQLIQPNMIKAVPSLLSSPYADFVDAVSAAARSNKQVIADICAVPAATVATAAIRQRALAMFDAAATIADKIRLVSEVYTLPQLQGIIEVDGLAILPDSAVTAIMDRYMMLVYANKYNIASKHPVVATPDNPIPNGGINTKAVEKEAREFLTAVRDRTKQIENCTQVARDSITYVAIACQCPVEHAFDLLTKKSADHYAGN